MAIAGGRSPLVKLRKMQAACGIIASLLNELEQDIDDVATALERSGQPLAEVRRGKVPIPPALRWQVWERDNFACHYCGTRSDLSLDHKHPESAGGPTTADNLVTACRSCNSRKGVQSYDSYTAALIEPADQPALVQSQKERALAMLEAGTSMVETIRQVWHVMPGRSRAYNDARATCQRLRQEIDEGIEA